MATQQDSAPADPVQAAHWYAALPVTTAVGRTRAPGGGIVRAGVRLDGPPDVTALRTAVDELIAAHPALRTTYAMIDGRPVATVHPRLGADFAAGEPSPDDLDAPFDLEAGPMVRVRLGAGEDGSSTLVLAAPAVAAHAGALRRLLVELAGRPVPDLVPHAAHAEVPASWRSALGGAPPSVSWPATDVGREPGLGAVVRHLEPLVADHLRTAATEPAAVARAVLRALVARHIGRGDVTVVVPHAGPSSYIGPGPGLVPVHVDLPPSASLHTAAGLDHAAWRAAGGVDDAATVPALEFVLQELWPHRHPGAAPVAPIWCDLDESSDVDLDGERPSPSAAVADLGLRLSPATDGGLRAVWSYRREVLDAATVTNLADRYALLLAAALAAPDRPLDEFDLLTPADRALLDRHGPPDSPPPTASTLPDLVREWTDQTPEAPAVRYDDDVLTYGELDAVSDRVAARLLALGPPPEGRVGVMMSRSAHLPAVLLGVAKAGLVCVPMDPTHPQDRLEYVLRDAGVLVVVADPEALLPPVPGVRAFPWPALIADGTAPPSSDRRPVPGQLAYVLYTSGSTGRPKGVAVTHRGLANCLTATRDLMGFRPGQTLLAITTISFDIAMLETFLPLVSGGCTLVAAQAQARDGEALHATLDRLRPDVVQATPLTWQILLRCGWPGRSDLVISCGGDLVAPSLAARLRACTKGFWHTYGPTEASLYTVCDEVPAGPADHILPIGTPIAGTWVRVLDDRLRPVPPGVVGELCVGGAGLARGYVNLPGLTASRFVCDPELPGQRLYRTGDLARLLPDGRLELRGRNDRQVKIRGHRIEPGEIENVLGAHPSVAVVAAVVVGAGDDRRIVAFVQPAEGVLPGQLLQDIGDYAKSRLPAYLVPSAFAVLESLPVNPNGKVDRRALARLRPPSPARPAPAVTDPVVQQIEGLLATVSGVRRPDGDDLFDRGLRAAGAVRLVALLNAATGAALPLDTLYAAPTVPALRDRLRSSVAAGDGHRHVRWLRGAERLSDNAVPPGALPAPLIVVGDPHRYRALLDALEPHRPVGVVDEAATDDLLATPGLGRTLVLAAGPDATAAVRLVRRIHEANGTRLGLVLLDPAEPPAGPPLPGPVHHVRSAGADGTSAWRAAVGRGLVDIAVPVRDLLEADGAGRISGLLTDLN
jgi:amino acid adenylation domain-containing protein